MLKRVGSVAVLTLLVGVGSGCSEAEDPDQGFDYIQPEVLALMRTQEAVRPAVQRLHQEIDAGKYPGAMTVAFDDDGVALWWKGDLPDGMKRAIVEAERIAPVRVHPALYSRAELEAEAEVIAEKMRAHPELGLQSVTILGDGSGLRVGVRASEADRAAAKLGQPAFVRDLPAVSVPVATVLEEPVRMLATRENDSPPYNGGGRILSHSRSCTSGWGVYSRSSGTSYLLTAAHCATPPDWIHDGAGDWVGNASREHWKHDVLLVTAQSMPWMFDGGVNSNWHKGVSGWGWATPNEYLCHSGATSGAVCDIKTATNWDYESCGYDSDEDYICANDLITAYLQHNGTVARPGDSGGPVFVLDGSRVNARGTITGGSGTRLLFQDFATARRDFSDLEIKTWW